MQHLKSLSHLCLLLLTGCMGVLPLPTTNKVAHGTRISRQQVAFIHPGHTTRYEVVTQLGADYHQTPRCNAIAYTWELQGGGGAWWIWGPYGGTQGSWTGGWRGFFVAFDHSDIVTRTHFKLLRCSQSLDVQLENWAVRDARPRNRRP